MLFVMAAMSRWSDHRSFISALAIGVVAIACAGILRYADGRAFIVVGVVVGAALVVVLSQTLWKDVSATLRWIRALLDLALAAWYIGISAWLIRRVYSEISMISLTRRLRVELGVIAVTALVPALIFFGVPRIGDPGPWWTRFWLILVIAPATVATLAVVPRWLQLIILGASVAVAAGSGLTAIIVVAGLLVIAEAVRRAIPFANARLREYASPPREGRRWAAKGLEQIATHVARAAFVVSGVCAAAVAPLAASTFQDGRVDNHVTSTGWIVRPSDLAAAFSPAIHVVGNDVPTTCPDPNACSSIGTTGLPVYAIVRHVPPLGNHASAPLAAATRILIAYWLYYPDDVFDARTSIGDVRQAHIADWEVVYVGLDEDTDLDRVLPLWIGYSSHCGGSWLPWTAAQRVSTANEAQPLHPEVWVAKGSHANYPSPTERSPNWASCVPPAWLDSLVGVLSFSAGVDEVMKPTSETAEVTTVVPSADLTKLRPLGDGDTVSMFHWLVGTGDPVPSPAARATDRLAEIFRAGGHWHCAAVHSETCRVTEATVAGSNSTAEPAPGSTGRTAS